MKRNGCICIGFFVLVTFPVFARRTVVIAGTGDSQKLLRVLAKAYEKRYPAIRIEIPDSIGSGGGIQALLQGKVDLARTARPLKDDEKNGLLEHLFGKSPVVFVTHPSVRNVSTLTAEQILGIYAGKYRFWSDLGGSKNKIFPVDRESGDSTRVILEKNIPGFQSIRSKAKVFYTVQDTLAAIMSHKNTVGFLPLNATKATKLRVLGVEGIQPSARNVRQDRYKYHTLFYIVSKGKPSGPEKDFINFLRHESARKIMVRLGVFPARP